MLYDKHFLTVTVPRSNELQSLMDLPPPPNSSRDLGNSFPNKEHPEVLYLITRHYLMDEKWDTVFGSDGNRSDVPKQG